MNLFGVLSVSFRVTGIIVSEKKTVSANTGYLKISKSAEIILKLDYVSVYIPIYCGSE